MVSTFPSDLGPLTKVGVPRAEHLGGASCIWLRVRSPNTQRVRVPHQSCGRGHSYLLRSGERTRISHVVAVTPKTTASTETVRSSSQLPLDRALSLIRAKVVELVEHDGGLVDHRCRFGIAVSIQRGLRACNRRAVAEARNHSPR